MAKEPEGSGTFDLEQFVKGEFGHFRKALAADRAREERGEPSAFEENIRRIVREELAAAAAGDNEPVENAIRGIARQEIAARINLFAEEGERLGAHRAAMAEGKPA